MDQIYPDDGLIEILQSVVAPGLVWHLYVNDVTPGLGDNITTYTEAAWSGYAPITVAGSNFTFTNLSAHVGQVTADFLLFGNTSGILQTVYGYYVTDLAGMHVIAAARFDNAPVIIPLGGTQSVLPGIANYSAVST